MKQVKVEFRHEKLEVWHLAMDFIDVVYDLLKGFPLDEKFGLTDQIKRAAISVALNIAEGASRQSNKDFAHFIRTSIGSLMEVDTGFEIAFRRHYIAENDRDAVREKVKELYFKLLGLNKALRDSI